MAIVRKIPWTRKPPPGTPLNKGHPLFPDVICLPFNEGHGVPIDHAGIHAWQNHTAAPTWGTGQYGHHLDFTAAGNTSIRTTGNVDGPDPCSILFISQSDAAAAVNERPFGYHDNWEGQFNSSVADIEWELRGGTLNSSFFDYDAGKADWHTYSGDFATVGSAVEVRYVFDGDAEDAITDPSPNAPTDAPLYVGTSRALTSGLDGRMACFYMWSRMLTKGEHVAITANPWQIFEPRRVVIPVESAGLSANLGLALQTDVAQAMSKAKDKLIGLLTETDLSQAIGGAKKREIGLVTELDIPFVLGKTKLKTLRLLADLDVAFAMSIERGVNLGLVLESDTTFVMSTAKALALGLVSETDVVFPITTAPVIVITNLVQRDARFQVKLRHDAAFQVKLRRDGKFAVTVKRDAQF